MKSIHRIGAMFACAVMALVLVVPTFLYADASSEYVTLNKDKSSLTVGSHDVFELYFDIAQDAPADIKIDVAAAVVELANSEGDYVVMPGDRVIVNVHINNTSSHPYEYVDNSLVVSTASTDGMCPLSQFTGADGQAIPLSHIGAIAPNMKAIRELMGVGSGKNISAEQVFAIYDHLEAAGYTGENALTDYLLDYYNNRYGTSYVTFEELAYENPQLADEFARAGQSAGFTLSQDDLDALCALHPEIAPYVVTLNTSADGTINFQVKWPEASIATFSYNIFYQEFFSAAFGEDIARMNPYYGDDLLFCRDHGVLDYSNPSSEVYTAANAYFAGLTGEALQSGESLDYEMVLTLDGPGVGNGYANYDFSFAHSIELTVPTTSYTVVHNYYSIVDNGEPVLDGSVTTEFEGHVGDSILAASAEKLFEYEGITYELDRASHDLVLVEDPALNVLVINYAHRTTTPVDPQDVDPQKPSAKDPQDESKPSEGSVLPQTSDMAVLSLSAMALGGISTVGGALIKRKNK